MGGMIALLEAPLRRPLHVLLPTLVGLVAALASDRMLPRLYRASASVRADWHEAQRAVSARGTADEAPRNLAYVRLHALARDAIEQVLREARPYSPDERPRSEQARAVLEAAGVRSGEGGSYLVEYAHPDPEKAAFVANRLAGLLVQGRETEITAFPESDLARLSARLEEARRSIEEKEVAIREFQACGAARRGRPTEGTPPRPGGRREIETVLAEAWARRSRLQEAIAAAEPVDVVEAPPSELERLRAERRELSKRYTDAHPDIQVLDRRIRRLEAELPPAPEPTPASALRVDLAAVDAEIEALEKEAAGLERASVPTPTPPGRRAAACADSDLAALADELAREHEAYLALLEQWRASETAARFGHVGRRARFELLRAAVVPAKPEGPSRDLLAVIGLAMGLVAGLCAALVAERRDPRIKGPGDLESVLEEPLLATIPRVRRALFRRH